MNSILIATLIATVSAEAGYTCTQPDPAWTAVDKTAADAAACGTVCTNDATDETLDYCCLADTTLAVGSTAASTVCTLYSLTAVDGANIKTAMAATDTNSFEAWNWNRASLADDMAASDAAASDSASMISSAIATIAAIAMVAY